MLPPMYPRATLAATILGSSLAFIDGSVVNVALPALARDLKVDPANLSWAINAYLLPLGALILLGGALGDHFGRRRLFQIGLSIFTVASVICAAAPSFAWLLALNGTGLRARIREWLLCRNGIFALRRERAWSHIPTFRRQTVGVLTGAYG